MSRDRSANPTRVPGKRTLVEVHAERVAASQRDELASVREAARREPAHGCFVAGTAVWTATGLRAVETLTTEDRAIATDVATFARADQAIAARFTRTAWAIIDVHVGGTVISCSAEHPFWVPGAGWRAAATLEAGMLLLGAFGELTITAVELRPGETAVYNLEVAGAHTYLVSPLGILVHNRCGQ